MIEIKYYQELAWFPHKYRLYHFLNGKIYHHNIIDPKYDRWLFGKLDYMYHLLT